LYISRGEEFDEGSHFAEYKLLSELGQGGFGKVFEAKHRISKEKVAIKIAENNK
jgi:serine/threonine protein kinase